MKRLALVLALLLAPSLASAQCTGVFANNQVCGNTTGSNNTARPVAFTTFPSNITIGVTTVSGGTNQYLLFNNNGILGNESFAALLALPTQPIDLTTHNGTALTAMRSDAAPPLSQAISPTWTGNHAFNPTSGDAITITPATGLGRGIVTNQTLTGPPTGTFGGANKIIASDNFDTTNVTTPPNASTGLYVGLTSGGSSTKGSRASIWGDLTVTADAAVSNTGRDFVAITGFAHSAAAMPSTGVSATLFGMNPAAHLTAGASGWAGVGGGEVDIGSDVSVPIILGWNIVNNGTSQASTLSTANLASAASGSPGWLCVYCASNYNGANAVATTGTFAGVLNAQTMAKGIDLSPVTFTSFAFASTGFSIAPTGATTINGGTNVGLIETDGTVTGTLVPSNVLTNSLVLGTTSNHPLAFITNNTNYGSISNAGVWRLNAYGTGVIHSGSTGILTSSVVTNGDLANASTTVNGQTCTLGSTCTIASNLTVGSSTITSGTNTRVLFDNSGTLGEYSITGTGNVAMSASPTFTGTLTAATITPTTINAFTLGGTIAGGGNQINNVIVGASTPLAGSFTTVIASTSITSPLHIGGSGTTGTQSTFQSTSGNGTTDGFAWTRGNNGATTAMTLNNTGLGVGSVAPDGLVSINANTAATVAVAAGTNLHIVGADAVNNIQTFDSFGAQPIFAARRANGTLASKTGLVANDIIFTVSLNGWDTAAYVGTGSIQSIATETWSASARGSAIRFSTTPLTTTATAIAMQIQPSGGLTIGATIATDPGVGGIQVNGQQFNPNMASDAATADSTVCTATTGGKLLKGSGTLGICLGTSSARYKQGIVPMRGGLADLIALQPKNFFYKKGHGDDGAREQYGFTAEDFYKVFPKLTHLDAQGKPLSIDLLGLVPVLVQGMKELKADNDNMKLQIAALKKASAK